MSESEGLLSKTSENAPGMIYQFLMHPDGTACFPYCSSWCKTMLGIEPETLRTDAAPLLDLIILEDRARFEDSVKLSACAFDLWRWEGRVRAKGGDPI